MPDGLDLPNELLDLPRELLEHVVSCCESPADIARAAAISRVFHASHAEKGIHLWAQERGFELLAKPEGEGCAVRWQCFAALLCESNPPARATAGCFHSLFIDGEGRLSSCGTEYNPGLLGHGEGVTQLNTPTRLLSTLGGERAVSGSAGTSHILALAADGAVWSWGYGYGGRLGHGDELNEWQPKKIEAFAGQRVVAVSAGQDHSLALAADGAVWSWGYKDYMLGHGDQQDQLLPKKVEALAGQRVLAVSAGRFHSLAISADGALWSWGRGGAVEPDQPLPKKIEAFAGQRVVAVSAGGWHSLAITADGAVWSWGAGLNGRLGHGDTQRQLLPKKVEALVGRRVVAVSAGGEHSLALTADGALWSWGEGNFGRLGHGDTQTQLLPKKVEALAARRVVSVSAGMCHSIARTARRGAPPPGPPDGSADGSVFTWGLGERGLGHGEDLSSQLLPKEIEAWGLGQ